VKVKVGGKLYVVFERKGRVWEVEVPGVYVVPLRHPRDRAYAFTVDVASDKGELVDVGLLLVGAPEQIAKWALEGAVEGPILDEAWLWALEALREGRARVEVRSLAR